MRNLLLATLRGVLRDKIYHGILLITCLFLLLPTASAFSMRQVTELSITLSLSLTSFILLLLAVFLGGTSLWKDIERRYVFSVMGLPISRGKYLLGKFCGIACFILLSTALLTLLTVGVVAHTSSLYPPGHTVAWSNLLIALTFDAFKYCLLVAIAFFFSTVSTSFFLPIFGSITIFIAGNTTQEVFDYLQTQQGQALPPLAKNMALALYYLLPNFGAFDLKANAIYSLPVNGTELLLTAAYGSIYMTILLSTATLLFSRRELQ